ncbi:MAG: hypothetical protein HQK53_07160, partial [Oligoflexia bacterium]|nr:hypothetical protein [Oligoflexia bacterium]
MQETNRPEDNLNNQESIEPIVLMNATAQGGESERDRDSFVKAIMSLYNTDKVVNRLSCPLPLTSFRSLSGKFSTLITNMIEVPPITRPINVNYHNASILKFGRLLTGKKIYKAPSGYFLGQITGSKWLKLNCMEQVLLLKNGLDDAIEVTGRDLLNTERGNYINWKLPKHSCTPIEITDQRTAFISLCQSTLQDRNNPE